MYRYLDPRAGRWTQEDPIGVDDGLNRYRYAQNQPALLVDPSGLIVRYNHSPASDAVVQLVKSDPVIGSRLWNVADGCGHVVDIRFTGLTLEPVGSLTDDVSFAIDVAWQKYVSDNKSPPLVWGVTVESESKPMQINVTIPSGTVKVWRALKARGDLPFAPDVSFKGLVKNRRDALLTAGGDADTSRVLAGELVHELTHVEQMTASPPRPHDHLAAYGNQLYFLLSR